MVVASMRLHVLTDRIVPGSYERSQSPSNEQTYLRQTHGGILQVGRHKGMFFSEVLELESDYCFWVRTIHTVIPCR